LELSDGKISLETKIRQLEATIKNLMAAQIINQRAIIKLYEMIDEISYEDDDLDKEIDIFAVPKFNDDLSELFTEN
jgi:hypothetical protein